MALLTAFWTALALRSPAGEEALSPQVKEMPAYTLYSVEVPLDEGYHIIPTVASGVAQVADLAAKAPGRPLNKLGRAPDRRYRRSARVPDRLRSRQARPADRRYRRSGRARAKPPNRQARLADRPRSRQARACPTSRTSHNNLRRASQDSKTDPGNSSAAKDSRLSAATKN